MPDEKLINAVKKLFENDCSGHDFYHTLRVMKTAGHIAAKEGADIELVTLAALLHDADDIKLFGSDSKNALQLMSKFNIPADVQQKVCDIIGSISFSGTGLSVPDSLEGRIVQDADRLDATGAIGIARTFAYGGSRGRSMYDPENPPSSALSETEYRTAKGSGINHFYEKLLKLKDLMNTDTARQLAEHRHAVMLEFLDEFYAEWDGIR